jgi:hypothetical protein
MARNRFALLSGWCGPAGLFVEAWLCSDGLTGTTMAVVSVSVVNATDGNCSIMVFSCLGCGAGQLREHRAGFLLPG